MDLGNAQLITLGTYINANLMDPPLNDQELAIALNAQASPDFWVFKTSVATDTARESLDWDEVLDETTGLTELQRWGLDTLLHNGDFNPALEQTRDGLVAIFPGADFVNTRASILAASTRLATLGEKVLSSVGTGPAGGDGSDQTHCAVMGDGAEGLVSVTNVIAALTAVE